MNSENNYKNNYPKLSENAAEALCALVRQLDTPKRRELALGYLADLIDEKGCMKEAGKSDKPVANPLTVKLIVGSIKVVEGAILKSFTFDSPFGRFDREFESILAELVLLTGSAERVTEVIATIEGCCEDCVPFPPGSSWAVCRRFRNIRLAIVAIARLAPECIG